MLRGNIIQGPIAELGVHFTGQRKRKNQRPIL
jgi:hypothetical protein